MSTPILASKIRHRLTLQKPIYSRDEIGGTMIAWHDVAAIWGSIEPLRGEERFQFQKMQTRQNFKISVRFRADIVPDLRLKKGNRLFLIRSISDIDEQNRMLVLFCEEINNN